MKFGDYYQVRDWLEGFIPLVYGKEELGLSRIENLLKLLGNPERKFKSIHIAGTSGKGSTAFYIAKLLQCSKFEIRNPKSETNSKFKNSNDRKVSSWSRFLTKNDIRASNFPTKVGLHISPHLVDIRERMQILRDRRSEIVDLRSENDGFIPMGWFVGLMSEIKSVVEKIQKKKPELTPSYFEILVAASFKYFAEEKVDWAVVEVGLGGRLDATNVLMPEISVITNIGLDHTEILGDTVEKISYEKTGIIKKEVPVVTAATGKGLKVIEKVAKEKSSKVIKVNTQKLSKKLSIQPYSTGPFLAYEVLKQLKIPVKKDLAKKVFSVKFPGRFEEITGGVILDGAHNPDKIRALLEFVRKLQIPNSKFQIILVIAFKKGKNWKKMIDLLMKNLPVREVIVTQFYATTDTGKFAAVEAEEIRDYVAKVRSEKCKVISNSQEAVFYSLNAKRNLTNSLVLVTGSLYLVGEVRAMWYLPSFDT